MDKVFVTGANGLLGTNLTLLLLQQGYSVIALVRRKSSFIKPNLDKLTLVEGELLDGEKLKNVTQSCRYLVHIAANTSQNLLKLDDYYEANIQGTENVIQACIHNNIKKLIYVGTANTYGYGSLDEPGSESNPMKHPFTKSLYAMSKKQAQDMVDKASSQLNITSISPTFMLGSYDTKPSSGRIILMALNKRFVFYPSGGKNFVHVCDVAKAIIKAFDIKASGQKFILANENLSYKAFYKKVLSLNKQKTSLIYMPDILLRIIGLLGDCCRSLRIKTDASSANTKALTICNYYSNKKAKNDLNMEFTSIDKAIADSLKYFNQKNKVQ
ncbi:NAD-dependent epimerase/dehydratase family protein [Carboxylicivirga sp. M1479]|uniref:NAD-dependent epimerase/dehydratase family protein n=1 Tax=Carboxylicivirga sp. M1479 TaxID=2594476 RepID=UPI0011778BE6|nr:NAD-dependent epimerase/dehydratase family protein [Carboxylicivirga sp. M1479]TRX71449.1 NAD-dependent epimerase/dehydratase family protein [Carboxylicivirga sp. M1479]